MATILSDNRFEICDCGARNELVRGYLPLVRAIARRFAHRGEELDDLVQVGAIGLIAAADRFRPERGRAFAAYAVPTIAGEIQRHLRDRTPAVRLPRRLHELRGRLPAAQSELGGELGRRPTAGELAGALGVPEDDVARLLAGDGAAVLEDELEGEDPWSWADDRLVVLEALRTLDKRRRAILHLRFFAGLSQADIGRRLGISQIHVSRLLRSGLDELRAHLDRGR